MIGYFGYTVWLTYASLLSALIGIFVCFMGGGHPYAATYFLLFSGLCDAFDGIVARSKKDRTQSEKQYGVQIDSLADLVAFGVLPACIGAGILMKASPESITGKVPAFILVTVLCVYVLAALVRLAWFNVKEEENQRAGIKRTSYTGLPVTSSALLFPTYILVDTVVSADISIGYFPLVLLTAAAFVGKFTVRKPKLREVLILVAIGVFEVAAVGILRALGVIGK